MNQDPNVIIGPVSFQGFKFKLYGSMTYLKASTSHCQPTAKQLIVFRAHKLSRLLALRCKDMPDGEQAAKLAVHQGSPVPQDTEGCYDCAVGGEACYKQGRQRTCCWRMRSTLEIRLADESRLQRAAQH